MGRVFQREYWKRLPDGTRTRAVSKHWYAEWQVAGDTRRKKIGTKQAATAALAKFEEAEVRRRHGLSDPAAEAQARSRPLAELLVEYLEVLAGKGTDPEYRATTDARLTRVLTECKWRVWSDVTADSLTAFLGKLRDRPKANALRGVAKTNAGALHAPASARGGKGCSPATLNGYQRAAKAFTRWLADKFDAKPPLAKLKPYPEEVDRRRSKQILTDAQLGTLLASAAATKHKGTSTVRGADRAMLYRIAADTGLRAGELAELTPLHFALDAAPPVVTVWAKDAKGKREEPIPLPAHLVETLRTWLAGFAPTAKLFPGKWAERKHETRWLSWDLARAGLPTHDDQGRRLNFHSLKRRYVVRLIDAGAKIHEVRRMARHVDIATTLTYYTDENLKDLGQLANRLPKV